MFIRNNPTGFIYQPPLSLDRGLNCFQIFSMLYATISFAIFYFISVCLRSFIRKRKNAFNLQNIYVTADNRYQYPILHRCFHSSSENPLCLSLLSLFPSPLFQGGGRGCKKCQLPCERPNVQLFEFEKNRKQNIILCVHFHMHVLKLAW